MNTTKTMRSFTYVEIGKHYIANSVNALIQATPTTVFRDLCRAGRHLRVELNDTLLLTDAFSLF